MALISASLNVASYQEGFVINLKLDIPCGEQLRIRKESMRHVRAPRRRMEVHSSCCSA